jgi:hypothetical protein
LAKKLHAAIAASALPQGLLPPAPSTNAITLPAEPTRALALTLSPSGSEPVNTGISVSATYTENSVAVTGKSIAFVLDCPNNALDQTLSGVTATSGASAIATVTFTKSIANACTVVASTAGATSTASNLAWTGTAANGITVASSQTALVNTQVSLVVCSMGNSKCVCGLGKRMCIGRGGWGAVWHQKEI